MKKGKQCSSYGMINVQGAVQCRDCGTNLEAIKAALYNDSQFYIARDPIFKERIVADVKTERSDTSGVGETRYGMARSVAGGVEGLGWAVVVIGAITTIMSIGNANRYFSLVTLLPSLGTLVSGLFMIMGAQVTKATVDNADNTRELLNIARQHISQKEQSLEVKED